MTHVARPNNVPFMSDLSLKTNEFDTPGLKCALATDLVSLFSPGYPRWPSVKTTETGSELQPPHLWPGMGDILSRHRCPWGTFRTGCQSTGDVTQGLWRMVWPAVGCFAKAACTLGVRPPWLGPLQTAAKTAGKFQLGQQKKCSHWFLAQGPDCQSNLMMGRRKGKKQ